jgi:hypothetical protein
MFLITLKTNIQLTSNQFHGGKLTLTRRLLQSRHPFLDFLCGLRAGRRVNEAAKSPSDMFAEASDPVVIVKQGWMRAARINEVKKGKGQKSSSPTGQSYVIRITKQ